MSAHDNGGPAFPYGVRVIRREGYGDSERTIEENEVGMTLRDYFAAKAMQGWLASYADNAQTSQVEKERESLARFFYALADAMLKERAR